MKRIEDGLPVVVGEIIPDLVNIQVGSPKPVGGREIIRVRNVISTPVEEVTAFDLKKRLRINMGEGCFQLTAAAARASAPIGRPGSSDGSCIWMPYDVK